MANFSMLELLSFGNAGWGDELAYAALITLGLGVCAIALGFAMGIALAGMKVSGIVFLQWLAEIYTLIIRGVPEFLILLLVYFGSEQLINATLGMLGYQIAFVIPKFFAAVLGLGCIFAAYSCEVFRGAYLAVPLGQIEAAQAVGMSRVQILTHIRVPQLWRFAIAGLGNLWMVMVKDTSLAAVIALDELLRVAKIAGEVTRNPLFFFAIAGAVYLLITILSDQIRKKAERHSHKGFAR